ncbi:hypothetical protein [Pontibacter sp. HSC-36F09]|uniref:hypothetical protein n=1 Tax=Pontibacter sp. HSC-36F09 TaxID=2910966 RepID=UPI0020A1DE9F|nr:hypothetical protein [Pontibacter sp. HSC-36F09]
MALSSCEKREFIYYEYDGTVITRVNRDAESYFYYGRYNENSSALPDEYIRAEYAGFDGIMNAYLVFEKGRKVRFVEMYDYFEQIGNSPGLYLFEYKENADFIKWHDSIAGDYDNSVFIYNVTDTERLVNQRNNSKVAVEYPKQAKR